MSAAAFIPILFITALTPSGALFVSDTSSSDYPVYPFNPAYGDSEYDDGWSHGSLLSAPNWLLAQIDQNLKSTVLDQGVTPFQLKSQRPLKDILQKGTQVLKVGTIVLHTIHSKKRLNLNLHHLMPGMEQVLHLKVRKEISPALEAYAKAITYAKAHHLTGLYMQEKEGIV